MTTISKLDTLNLESLRRCPVQFRPVKKDALDYYLLRESIEREGILVPLLVRPVEDYYEVVDGNHRLEISLDLRRPDAPCIIRNLTDEEVLRIQTVIHAVRVDVTTVEYAARLWRIINIDGTMTVEEVAHSLSKHPDWVKRTLGLVNLIPLAKFAMKEGLLPVTLAGELAKLPASTQERMLNEIKNLTRAQSRAILQLEVRAYRGQNVTRPERGEVTSAKFRSYGEIQNELADPVNAASVLLRCNANNPLDVWKAALSWVHSVDPASLEERQRKLEKEEQQHLKRNTENFNSLGDTHE